MCYVIDALIRFLVPTLADTSAAVFVLPETLCEVSLLAYLLIKGVRTPQLAVLDPEPPEHGAAATPPSEVPS